MSQVNSFAHIWAFKNAAQILHPDSPCEHRATDRLTGQYSLRCQECGLVLDVIDIAKAVRGDWDRQDKEILGR